MATDTNVGKQLKKTSH